MSLTGRSPDVWSTRCDMVSVLKLEVTLEEKYSQLDVSLGYLLKAVLKLQQEFLSTFVMTYDMSYTY
jgi:hypothetical protein